MQPSYSPAVPAPSNGQRPTLAVLIFAVFGNKLIFVVFRNKLILAVFGNKRIFAVFWKQTDIDKWTFNGVSKILEKKGLKKKKIQIKNFFNNSSSNENLKKYIPFGKGI